MAKVIITQKQALQFNKMHEALTIIYKQYQTPEQMRKNSKQQYGISFEETLEYAYENVRETARANVKGIRKIKFEYKTKAGVTRQIG